MLLRHTFRNLKKENVSGSQSITHSRSIRSRNRKKSWTICTRIPFEQVWLTTQRSGVPLAGMLPGRQWESQFSGSGRFSSLHGLRPPKVASNLGHPASLDETTHLPSGRSHWELGGVALCRANPPLIRMWAAVPLLATRAKTDWRSYSDVPHKRTSEAVRTATVSVSARMLRPDLFAQIQVR